MGVCSINNLLWSCRPSNLDLSGKIWVQSRTLNYFLLIIVNANNNRRLDIKLITNRALNFPTSHGWTYFVRKERTVNTQIYIESFMIRALRATAFRINICLDFFQFFWAVRRQLSRIFGWLNVLLSPGDTQEKVHGKSFKCSYSSMPSRHPISARLYLFRSKTIHSLRGIAFLYISLSQKQLRHSRVKIRFVKYIGKS